MYETAILVQAARVNEKGNCGLSLFSCCSKWIVNNYTQWPKFDLLHFSVKLKTSRPTKKKNVTMNILDILERGIKDPMAKIRLKLPSFLRIIVCLPRWELHNKPTVSVRTIRHLTDFWIFSRLIACRPRWSSPIIWTFVMLPMFWTMEVTNRKHFNGYKLRFLLLHWQAHTQWLKLHFQHFALS